MVRIDSAHQLQKFDTMPITNSKIGDKMAAVHGKVTAFVGLTHEK